MKIIQMLAKKLTKFLATFNDSRKMKEKRLFCFSIFESVLKKDETFNQNQTCYTVTSIVHTKTHLYGTIIKDC